MLNDNKEIKELGFLNLIIIVLSLYILIALLIDTFFELPEEISNILSIVDDAICLVFLYDFFYRFIKADNKIKFMK